MAVLLIGWKVMLMNWTGIIGVAVFVGFITRFQIIPEERMPAVFSTPVVCLLFPALLPDRSGIFVLSCRWELASCNSNRRRQTDLKQLARFRMSMQILFIHGAGDGGYEADEVLVASLRAALGKGYMIGNPEMQWDESALDFGWTKQIGEEIAKVDNELILAGHSFGASMILKCLSETTINKKIKGVFLLAAPFWSGNEEWKAGLKLKTDFAGNLPADVPFFLYHCKDDEEVPVSHFEQYRQKLTWANFREIKSGGHQLNNDLTLVAKDIKTL